MKISIRLLYREYKDIWKECFSKDFKGRNLNFNSYKIVKFQLRDSLSRTLTSIQFFSFLFTYFQNVGQMNGFISSNFWKDINRKMTNDQSD